MLAGQNNDLQKELDEFVATDEMIRSGLDRKGRVSQMKERNSYNERQSLQNVERSRSPRRSCPRVPFSQKTNMVQVQQQMSYQN